MNPIYNFDQAKNPDRPVDDRISYLADRVQELISKYNDVQQINLKLASANQSLSNRVRELEKLTSWMEV